MDIVEQYFLQLDWQGLIFATLRILLILVIAWVVINIAKTGLRRLERYLIESGRLQGEDAGEAAKRAETLVRLLRQAITIFIWILALLVTLNELGVSVGPILASAGVLGLAVGFGAQNLVRDVISGFFMILENQVRVGDVAVVNGTGGLVEHVGFRTLTLRDLSGTVHVFPNGGVTTLANVTKEWSAYVFDIRVAYKEDTDRVIEVMRQVGSEMRQDEYFGPLMLEDVDIFGVDQLADSAVIIKGRIRTLPIRQWETGRQFLRRVKQAFDREGIEIPFPHRSLYFGDASKPVLVQLAEQAGVAADDRAPT
ncbi:MAG: mechanosensitive ion channel family protein [Chromatiales bacterium]|jgi:small conductance mechanosensitive channel|nr:mechanosensitive ion channel family protein [Chromatiales bacterium]MDX9768188.1 mechanosensitive ion channel family protein [Ectothiorhodospiraceae bacterium]